MSVPRAGAEKERARIVGRARLSASGSFNAGPSLVPFAYSIVGSLDGEGVARFRLRFLLQELDLVGSVIVIGRSPECQITIEDPLVSRQHARITVRDDTAFIMDLGSRNGVRINGDLIRGDAPLKHNDRVRLGTQDLVFLVVDESSERLTRATGFMMNCRTCGRPFPGEVPSCPHCGAMVETGEDAVYDTITGLPQEPQASWTLQLLGEVVERALVAERIEEAERMLRRAAQELDQIAPETRTIDTEHVARMAMFALRLAASQRASLWAEWALGLHVKFAMLPQAEALDRIEQLDPELRHSLRPSLETLWLWWKTTRALAAGPEEQALATRVAAWVEAR